ncbi:MAG: hypothetical protein NVS9B7_09810 [Flavisolibacter sp.]
MTKTNGKKEIPVHAHWQGLVDPVRMGTLTVTQGKGKEVPSIIANPDRAFG